MSCLTNRASDRRRGAFPLPQPTTALGCLTALMLLALPGLASAADVAQVNFQPATSQPFLDLVNGRFEPWPVDSGAPFGDRGNGRSYGWEIDNSRYMVERNVLSDQRHDTMAFTDSPGSARIWEIALANGDYWVRIGVSGPPTHTGAVGYAAEGVVVASGVPTEREVIEGDAIVRVSDGRLTVTNAPGARFSRLLYIDIKTAKTVNVARGKIAWQSSTAWGGVATRGTDGNAHGFWDAGSVTHTSDQSANPWWQVDLGARYLLTSGVGILNRLDCCMERLEGAFLFYSESPFPTTNPLQLIFDGYTFRVLHSGGAGTHVYFFSDPIAARYLLLVQPNGSILSIAELEAWTTQAGAP